MTKKVAKNGKNALGKSYQALLKEIKEKVSTSQVKAALAVNQELIHLYWEVGTRLLIYCKIVSSIFTAKNKFNLQQNVWKFTQILKGQNLTKS